MFLIFLAALLKKANTEEEIKLLERIVLKDQRALEKLYDLYSKIIFSMVLRIVKNREDAEEILQNIFMQVWDKAGNFNSNKGSVYAWLITLARNKAIDKIRSSDFRNKFNLSAFDNELKIPEDIYPGTEIDAAIAQERSEYVKKALEQIPGKQREAIEMIFFEGYTQNEISEKLKLPLGTVKTRCRQGMMKLQNLLNDYL